MMTKDRANAIMQGAPATEEEKREAEMFLKEAGSSGSNYEGGTASEAKKAKVNPLKEIAGAVNRNAAGFGGSAMSGAQPSIQQTIEENKVLDEVAEATGQRPATIAGHAVGQVVHPEDVAEDLKNKDIAVKDEYKEKHPEVFAEEDTKETISEVTQLKKDDKPEVKAAKKKYNKATMSIWDAYNNGLIDKETAGYFTIDALSTLAKNIGRSIGNVGAQFTGGTIDNNEDESMWEQRRNEIFGQELQGEAESIDNYNNLMKRYNLNKASTINNLMQTMEKDIANMDDNNPLKVTYMALEAAMANGMIDGNTTLAATGAKGISSIIDWFKGEESKK